MDFALSELEAATEVVHRYIPPTPEYCWPLLSRRLGCVTWVKHENHTPIGAFKVRGGIVYLDALRRVNPSLQGIVGATRGNHGQSLAFAANLFGFKPVIVVPRPNSKEKNACIEALGAELVEHGEDFQEAFEFSAELAKERGFMAMPCFDPLLVKGVSSYSLEMFRHIPEAHVVYVPIGMGSGICGVLAARNALGLKTAVVGVVSSAAPAYKLSFHARRPISHAVTMQVADGMACRKPDERALEAIWRGVDHIVEVSDDEVEAAMRAYISDTHNIAEGAGASPLAAATKEKARLGGKLVILILSGGNVDRALLARVASMRS